jgi:hypothetical protein
MIEDLRGIGYGGEPIACTALNSCSLFDRPVHRLLDPPHRPDAAALASIFAPYSVPLSVAKVGNQGFPVIVAFLALANEHNPDPTMRPYAEPVTAELRERLIVGSAAKPRRAVS